MRPCSALALRWPAEAECLAVHEQAAKLRQAWREAQGAASISLDECQVRVADASAQDPAISLERLQVWESPARSMVAEMMILAGQIAATVGAFPLKKPLID